MKDPAVKYYCVLITTLSPTHGRSQTHVSTFISVILQLLLFLKLYKIFDLSIFHPRSLTFRPSKYDLLVCLQRLLKLNFVTSSTPLFSSVLKTLQWSRSTYSD